MVSFYCIAAEVYKCIKQFMLVFNSTTDRKVSASSTVIFTVCLSVALIRKLSCYFVMYMYLAAFRVPLQVHSSRHDVTECEGHVRVAGSTEAVCNIVDRTDQEAAVALL